MLSSYRNGKTLLNPKPLNPDLGLWVWGLGFRGSGVQGLGLGLRFQGLGKTHLKSTLTKLARITVDSTDGKFE